MTLEELRIKMNRYGESQTPFIAITDFEGEQCHIYPLADIPKSVQFNFSRVHTTPRTIGKIETTQPIVFEQYSEKFRSVAQHLHRGDTYLVNLTAKTPITLNCSLMQFYHSAFAKYKVFVENEFACFSPETFVKIDNDTIRSFPMKGTINAAVPNARETILADPKERAEHNTIVDLIRNDLSIVAFNVTVPRFRYIDEVNTQNGTLLQVSSEVRGELEPQWQNCVGDIITKLLPAGSISGAPKKKTIEVIQEAEEEPRGYYTGITAVFDGKSLDSCVNIRYIEKDNDQFFYRSGGGITAQSNVNDEYNELLDKIYVPTC